MAFVPFSLVLWILGLRSDILILFSYLPHLRSGACNIQSHAVLPKPPSLCTHPICTPQSHSHDTHTYYTVYTTHSSILFCIHTFFSSCCISLVSSLVPSRFVLHSLFPVCSDRFALILFVFCSRIVSPSSLLLLWSLVRSVLSLYLFLKPLSARRDSYHWNI
jgi:hypothetical protein